MGKRISITPQIKLLNVVPKWRRRFAEEAAEVILSEGRYKEIMFRIIGLSPTELTDQPAYITPNKPTNPRKPKAARAVPDPKIKLTPNPVPTKDQSIEMDHITETFTINEQSKIMDESQKDQLGLFF